MKNFNKYVIRQYSYQEYQHGGIGYADAENILLAEGFSPVSFPYYHSFSIIAKISRFFYFFKILFSIKKESVVVFLFPVFARMNRLLLYWLLKKNIHIICFIADIDGIKDNDPGKLKEEIKFLRRFNYFIVHNERMKQWLNESIPGRCSEIIEFFDFLVKPVTGNRKSSFDIVFAGNLEKSSFLEKLHLLHDSSPSLYFHLYGPGQTEAMPAQKNVSWHGVERPPDLPGKLKGSFGLVWDGDSIEGPGGSLGDYMRFISHHKLSLYIVSGLPVIVPAFAASAPLIEKYKIGFSVSNLFEIEEKIKSISEEEYSDMQKNMQPLAEKISSGECLKKALEKMIQEM